MHVTKLIHSIRELVHSFASFFVFIHSGVVVSSGRTHLIAMKTKKNVEKILSRCLITETILFCFFLCWCFRHLCGTRSALVAVRRGTAFNGVQLFAYNEYQTAQRSNVRVRDIPVRLIKN